jgi:chemotaxis protein MotB
MSQDFDINDDDNGSSNESGWMATYSDMVTLLFAFFVLLFAMSSVQEDKFEQLRKTLQEAIGKQEVPEAGTREGLSMKDVESDPQPEAIDELGGMIQQKEQEELVSEIKEFIMFNKLSGKVSAENTDGGAVITLSDMLMFNIGEAEMKTEGREILKKLAEILVQFKYKVNVIGHTDNVPISSGSKYKNNWELSTARACDIVDLLIEEGVDPIFLTAAGRASVEPVTSNETPEGRSRNRRVEIIYERSKISPDQIKNQEIVNETK